MRTPHICKSEDFDWKPWFTSYYMIGYWVCRICGNVKYKIREIEIKQRSEDKIEI